MAANNVRNENEILASSIQAKLHQQSPSRADHCIFRIPHVLVKGKKEVYVPHLLSIGPFQRGLQFQTMEVIKSWSLHCLLERKTTPTTVLEDFVGAIRDMEQDCRDCYEENIDLTSDEFVEMMVVDGCFIIELFHKFSRLVPIKNDDPVFHRPWMHSILINDLLLLENQLPWRVIECLFNLTRERNAGKKYSLSELTLKYFEGYTLGMRQQVGEELKGKHLLDLVKISLLPSCAQPLFEFEEHLDQTFSLRMPSVTELVESGVLFKRGIGEGMFNISFQHGVMKIPPIRVHKNGESLFRNLVAYEQCETASIITSYAVLLEQLITSDKDVEYLAKCGIIENVLGYDISLIFRSLSNDVRPPNCCYRRLYCDVNEYCGFPWNRHKRMLRTYFKNPLELVNFATAVVLVTILTLIQTVYSILSYEKPQQ
ncbi:PREDICTED: UPF0481 protein At3g47200-like [Prunus mume]|uniref:UPF0481 protein At3g47200-like n=1 Tax=Prunus mume TaxID=102107 RepID=A0ABM0NSF3_PRUMU|nr:PREDICTED: UPF0481 protein At3g47200-like [Prunus mume]XP_016649355.1 PREDICTED: UPF0481 protein At3g47200-like [Prunus mume]